MVDRQVSRAETERRVVEGISLSLDQDGAADGDGRLGADDGDDVLASLLVTDFLERTNGTNVATVFSTSQPN